MSKGCPPLRKIAIFFAIAQRSNRFLLADSFLVLASDHRLRAADRLPSHYIVQRYNENRQAKNL
jgi:hypothetical protein